MGQHGALWVAAWCAMPATPLTPAFAAAGLSSLRPAPFGLATLLGVLPRCALYTFLATSFVSGDQTRMILATGLLCAALVVGVLARRLWLRGGTDRGGA